MVRYHHRLAIKGFRKHGRQPVPAGGVQPDGILRCETQSTVLNDGEIRHLLPRLLHGEEPVRLTEQREVGPEDAAQEPHVIDNYLVVIQHVDVIRCLDLQFIDQG